MSPRRSARPDRVGGGMTRELRRLSLVVLVMFLALFVSTSWIQVIEAPVLAQNPENTRVLYDSYEVQRGAILADGQILAQSTPSNDVYTWQRVYPEAEMWAAVTGWFNPVLNSRTGLEAAMNPVLSGTADSQFLARVERIFTGQPARGSNVLTTLDPEVQRAAYEALGDDEGAVIALEPATGRILALVTSPSFDTNLLASHDTRLVDEVYSQLDADPLEPLSDRAIAGRLNPPGSTFKLVVTAAALASGQYTPDSTFEDPARWTLPGTSTEIANFNGQVCVDGTTVTLADALRLSCNIPFAQLAVALGDDAIRAQAEKFGFNSAFEIPLAATASVYPRSLNAPQTALSGFGQSDVIATPLQMALVSAGIANGGVVMDPQMIDSVVAPDLTVQQRFEAAEFGRALTEEQAEELTTLMIANVDSGAASNARIDGVDVAGKTGTAEHGPDDPYTLWFTGFAPADDPQVAVAVLIENGGGQGQSGGSNALASPVAKRVIEAVLSR